jgi:Rv2525c-like, glycoside hydrolase-like domain
VRNGKNAAKHALQIGFPEGVNVWLDLNGAKSRTAHEAMIAYCNAWFAEVESAGFVPGVYVGAGAILTGNELFWRLTTKHHWKSRSRVPDIPHRGYQLIQTIIRNDKRGMPSPDEGDAVALCFTEPEGSPFVRSTTFNRKIEYPGFANA